MFLQTCFLLNVTAVEVYIGLSLCVVRGSTYFNVSGLIKQAGPSTTSFWQYSMEE